MPKNPLGQLVEQAQAMQKKMQETQDELASMKIIGKAGGERASIEVTMTGRHDVTKVAISERLIRDAEDRELIQDLVAAAMNDAVQKVEEAARKKLSNIAQNMDLPGDLSSLLGGDDSGDNDTKH